MIVQPEIMKLKFYLYLEDLLKTEKRYSVHKHKILTSSILYLYLKLNKFSILVEYRLRVFYGLLIFV